LLDGDALKGFETTSSPSAQATFWCVIFQRRPKQQPRQNHKTRRPRHHHSKKESLKIVHE